MHYKKIYHIIYIHIYVLKKAPCQRRSQFHGWSFCLRSLLPFESWRFSMDVFSFRCFPYPLKFVNPDTAKDYIRQNCLRYFQLYLIDFRRSLFQAERPITSDLPTCRLGQKREANKGKRQQRVVRSFILTHCLF